MAGTRTDIAKLGGPWSDTMLWYARAVAALRTRPFDQRTSWTYLGAIHGFDPQGWLGQGILPQNTSAPSQDEMRLMFNQCQHAGWFFLPWHRGYLHAFEEILGAWITSQGGPADWALPYWNYLNDDAAGARDLPQEFRDPTLPDGSPNALSDARRGPATALGPQPWIPVDISLTAQTAESIYTADPGTLGYGGPISGFAQQGSAFGANESDPHNLVHVMIGGGVAVDPPGWMFDPNFAALDPIFWVHHCNVDRLWAAWTTDPAHSQEDSSPWRNGPFPRQFTMPDSTGGLSVFVPSETLPGEALEPTYDDLIDGTGIVPPPVVGGLEMMAARSPGRGSSALIGANESAVTVGRGQVRSRIAMTARPGAGGGALEGMGAGGGERVYLNLEGVRGESASGVLNVVLTKAGADPAAEGAEAVKTLVFFGLGNATSAEGPHGGSGLSATVEVTDIVRRLEATGAVGEIEAHVAQPSGDGPEITVDRITLYARPGG
ncbi:MAG: tyrosinase family protein [Pseudomonadota bacterium]